MSGPATVTAAVLVIGDEILSGRTKDRNIGYIAEYLARLGVDVREARVVPDVEDEIVAALDALRARYDYVVTTGGIGPTHDDITADAVARGFRRADRRGPARDGDHDGALSPGRPHARAAQDGAHPRGRRAGRKSDLQGAGISHRQCLRDRGRALGDAGDARFRGQVDANRVGHAGRDDRSGRLPEGRYGDALGKIAAARPDVSIGSYPSYKDGRFSNQIVVRGKDATAVAAARGGGRGDAGDAASRRQTALSQYLLAMRRARVTLGQENENGSLK